MKEKFWLSLILVVILGLILTACPPPPGEGEGEPPEGTFQKTFDNGDYELAHSVWQTEDGGYILLGDTTYSSDSYIWLVKTDTDGNMEWSKSFTGSFYLQGQSVQQTTDGGYIVAGTNCNHPHFTSMLLLKTDSTGEEEWRKTFPYSVHFEEGYSVQQTIDGGYILAGQADVNYPYHDFWLVKTDPEGNEEWDKVFGGDGDDTAHSVRQTEDGGYIIAGITRSFGTISGYSDVWLIKTNPEGNEEWDKVFGGDDLDGAHSVQQTDDGGFVIAGYTWSFGAGQYDVWLIKTNPKGNEEWNKTFGTANSERAFSVQQTADGGFVLAGSGFRNGTGNDVWLIKTDPEGNEEWDKFFGGDDLDEAYSVQQTDDGGFVLAGSTNSFGVYQSDMYLIKTDANGNAPSEPTP